MRTQASPETPVAGILAAGTLSCVLQPLVDLDSGTVLGHEALLRGPSGTPWEAPLVLLAAAREHGLLVDLELASLRASLSAAAELSSGSPTTLFVNLEPSTLTGHLDLLLDTLGSRAGCLQVVVEITERALAADLAGILAAAERLRAAGCAIALDDVGAEPESLASIPLLRPEVVKLDLRLLRTLADPTTIAVAGAVRAYAEASGAEVVAEGIETPEDLTRAMVLGASLGQGWLWGRPQRSLVPGRHRPERFAARPVSTLLATTPFDLASPVLRFRRVPKRLLLPVSRTLELTAQESPLPPVLLACFQDQRHFTPATARRYAALAARLPFVCALGAQVPSQPAAGVRGASLCPQDPLAREWTVVVLGAHESVALIARAVLGSGGAPQQDGDREFDFAVTYDRALVTAAAQALVGRLTVER